MSTVAFLLTTVLTVGRSAPAEQRPLPETRERVAVEVVIVRPGPVDGQALKRALSARNPWIQLYTFGAPGSPSPTGDTPGRRVFVDIVARAPGYSTTFILGDGRAYQRDVVGGESDIRELASAIANTIAAIEDAAIVPEPEPVELPAEPEATVATQPQTIRTPTPTIQPEPEPIRDPEKPPSSKSNSLGHDVANMSQKKRPELGVALAPVGVLLLAPGQLQGGSGFGGALHGSLRFPRGLGLDLGVRILGHERNDLRIMRTRVGIATGYIHRDGHLELAGLVGVSVEPWRLREAGDPVSLGASPLLGGFASLALGYHTQARKRLAVRVGGRLEFAGSALSSGRVPEIRRATEVTPTLVLGGFELALGLDLTLWISLDKS